MGRRKREIEKIRCERDRSVTFNKRKQGLFKKAFELSVLCDCDVALLVFGPNDTLSEYASSNMELLLKQYARMCTDPHDKKNNEDLYEQHFDNGTHGEDDDGCGDGGDDDEDEVDHDYDDDDEDDDGRLSSPRKRMRRMLMRRADCGAGAAPSCLGSKDAAIDRRLDALGRVPLSPRREAAFSAIFQEFNDLLIIQKVSKVAGQNHRGSRLAPPRKGPVKAMKGLSIAVPDSDTAVQEAKAEDVDAMHRRTKDGFFAFSPRLSREGDAVNRISSFLDHLDIPSPSDLLCNPNNLFSNNSSPVAGLGDDAFADLVVTGRRVSYDLPSAVALSPTFEGFEDMFTPRPVAPGLDAEVFLEHHGEGSADGADGNGSQGTGNDDADGEGATQETVDIDGNDLPSDDEGTARQESPAQARMPDTDRQ